MLRCNRLRYLRELRRWLDAILAEENRGRKAHILRSRDEIVFSYTCGGWTPILVCQLHDGTEFLEMGLYREDPMARRIYRELSKRLRAA